MCEILILLTTVQNVLCELNKANYEYNFKKNSRTIQTISGFNQILLKTKHSFFLTDDTDFHRSRLLLLHECLKNWRKIQSLICIILCNL